MWPSFVAIFRKELRHVQRDRAMLAMAFAFPIFQLSIFGFIDQSVTHVPTVIVDQDHSAAARLLMDRLRSSNVFEITEVTVDPREARALLAAGRAHVAVLIPPDFHERSAAGAGAKVLALIDGSDANVGSQALAAMNGIAAEVSTGAMTGALKARGAPVTAALSVQPMLLFNPAGRTANFIIPGLIAILLQLVAMVFTAVSLVREKEEGTLEQLLVTPIDPLGLMLGKLVPYLLLGFSEMGFVLAVARFGFGVPLNGSLLFLLAMSLLYLFAVLSLGLFVATLSATQAQAQQLAELFLLPSIFLSGFVFPREGLPVVLRWIARLLPATHMVEILRGVLLRGAGPVELLPNVVALSGLSALVMGLAASRFRKLVRPHA